MPPKLLSRLVLWLALAIFLAAAAGVMLLRMRSPLAHWAVESKPHASGAVTEAQVSAAFANASKAPVGRAEYDLVVRYLLEGMITYRSAGGGHVSYPGLPSYTGTRTDDLEGFARSFVVGAAWLGTGHPDRLTLAGREESLTALLKQGLVAGTTPGSPDYWGGVFGDYDQRIVEAADIALGLWLSRDRVWADLSGAERARVTAWLVAALDKQVHDGTWQLFPILIQRSLRALGADVAHLDERTRTLYDQVKSLHAGDGWFMDRPHGFDYYNSWAFHYSLFFIDQMDPDWDRRFIRETQASFARTFKHLFGPNGYPVMGRSTCYRTAAPTALVTASMVAPEAVSPGEAARALDLTWAFFVRRGGLQDGTISQGLCGRQPEVLDNYSGPASCLWGARSLIAALYVDKRNDLLTAARKPLPVEQGDFTLAIPAPGWSVAGERASGDIRLSIAANADKPVDPLRPHTFVRSVSERVLLKPRRPENSAALYRRPTYSTASPVIACPAPTDPGGAALARR